MPAILETEIVSTVCIFFQFENAILFFTALCHFLKKNLLPFSWINSRLGGFIFKWTQTLKVICKSEQETQETTTPVSEYFCCQDNKRFIYFTKETFTENNAIATHRLKVGEIKNEYCFAEIVSLIKTLCSFSAFCVLMIEIIKQLVMEKNWPQVGHRMLVFSSIIVMQSAVLHQHECVYWWRSEIFFLENIFSPFDICFSIPRCLFDHNNSAPSLNDRT